MRFMKTLLKKYRIPLIILGVLVLAIIIYFLPPVHQRLAWRVDNLLANIRYSLNPPEDVVFSPQQQAEMETMVAATMQAMLPSATTTFTPTLATPECPSEGCFTPTATATPTITPTPTPIPGKVRLEGVVYEAQDFNNCGPANLAMALSYWGWEGDQTDVAAVVKPNEKDRNVMPYEMLNFVQLQTEYYAIVRYGGDLDTLKKLIAAGFPVLIEKGFEEEVPGNKGWMGHYGVVTAYDDEKETVLIQDSFVAKDYTYTYARVMKHWQAFNYVYMVIFPYEKQAALMQVLGEQANEQYNLNYAVEKAQTATEDATKGRSAFFAWYNLGSSLVNLGDYASAARAYDQAYTIYADLPSYERPWRITWYQTGPYFAYYHSARYQDVVTLATQTLNNSFEPAIGETWVWRARAYIALGQVDEAISDLRQALIWHPDWDVALAELNSLGVQP